MCKKGTHKKLAHGCCCFYPLMADDPQRARLPVPTTYCNVAILPLVTKHIPIYPRFSPYDFLSRCKFSTHTTRQPIVEFCLLLTHALALSATEARIQILVFKRIELTTSALVGVRGYLLDHSGDEWLVIPKNAAPVTGTTLRTTDPVPVDCRQRTPSVRNCVTW